MASTAIAAGLALAAVGLTGRYIVRRLPLMTTKMQEALKNLPNFNGDSLSNSRYYKGGFEPKMTKREASLILGISPTAPKTKVKDAFKKVMSQNHPDRGGSPYIASKINEAKDLMESGKQQH